MIHINKIKLFALFAAIHLGGTLSQAQEANTAYTSKGNLASIQTSVKPGRIQINQWVDPGKGISDTLTPIVRVVGNGFSGTATLLEECRVITVLHVLLTISKGKETFKMPKNETLVGQRFQYQTRPLASLNGKRAVSYFTVLGHGYPEGSGSYFDAEEDWAIGYDESCLSEKLNLGYVKIFDGQYYEVMKNIKFVTAGYSYVKKAGVYGEDLYIDSECKLNEKYAQQRSDDSYFLTNCSLWHGGSGQLLFTALDFDGEIQFESPGHPILIAYGIFQAGDSHDEFNDGSVPYVGNATGFAPFTYSFSMKINRYLHGPVDPNLLSSNGSKRPPIAAAAAFRN